MLTLADQIEFYFQFSYFKAHISGSTDPGVVEFVLAAWHSKEPSLFADVSDYPSNVSSPSQLDIRFYNGSRVNSRKKRQVPCETGEELDEYVDSLFRFASRLIRAVEPFSALVPNATIESPDHNLVLFLHSGSASHAYTINRKAPAVVNCKNGSISLGFTLGFDELRVTYKFELNQNSELIYSGEVESQIKDPKVQIQFTQTTIEEDSDEKVEQRVDSFKIWSLGQIRIVLKGLGDLSESTSTFVTDLFNQNIDQFEPQIRDGEQMAIEAANRMLQNISIPFFSII